MDVDLQIFVRVAEEGSFTSAAQVVALTPSAVSKAVSRLEGRLDTRLFHRSTRKLALTPEGELFFERARAIVNAIDEAEAEIAGSRPPSGVLRVNCVTGFALHELSRAMPDFLADFPEIRIDLSVTDRVVDLIAEHVDLAIRSGPVSGQSLIVRKFAEFERRLFAAPDYLSAHGTPQTVEDLEHHSCILQKRRLPAHWQFRIGGALQERKVNGQINVNSAETALRLAISGAGIVRIAELIAQDAVADGQLVPVLERFHAPQAVPLYAVYPAGHRANLKSRMFIEFLVRRYSAVSWGHEMKSDYETNSDEASS